MAPPDDAGSKTPKAPLKARPAAARDRDLKARGHEIDYDAVADTVIRKYPKILSRLAE
jgi:hypothetical protein